MSADVMAVNCPCGSGRPFAQCHGHGPPPALVPVQLPVIAPPAVTRKLDLAAGQSPREGFEGVDIFTGAQHVVDLLRFPWPFADNSVAELHCSHFIEHIPMEFVDAAGNYVPCGTPGAKDLLFKFFEECGRILVPMGWMDVITPCARNDRAFQDPTHRRFIVAQTFIYMNAVWRKQNRLDHYNTDVHFGVSCNPLTGIPEVMALHPDAMGRRMQHEWNVIADWGAKLQNRKHLLAEDLRAAGVQN